MCKINNIFLKVSKKIIIGALLASTITACTERSLAIQSKVISPNLPFTINYNVKDSLTKKVIIDLDNPNNYASFSLYANGKLLIDNLNIPAKGRQTVNVLIRFDTLKEQKLSLSSNNAELVIHSLIFEDIDNIQIPNYQDISIQAGIDKDNSIKYGGPTVADIDNDGDYDFIVNNHNQQSSKLYWNNGDGTVTKHDKNLARWFMHDLHGTAVGDYDNDGDLDLVVTQGGGNGKDPSKANFYSNSNGTLVLTTGDVGITKGGRGRGAKWSDLDKDGDLDLMLINETSLAGSKPQHFFHENLGDGTFKPRQINGLQDQHQSRALITDINNDQVDDIVLFGPLSVWIGNGDFTFTDITAQLPAHITNLKGIMAVTDIDIDNDGDLDLYLARGKEFEGGFGESPSLDHDPITKELSIKPRGYKGTDAFDFQADGEVKLHSYYYLAQGTFRGKDYPVFLGKNKSKQRLANGEELIFNQAQSQGWPDDISNNGIYFGHIKNGQWKAALVRDGDIFWGFNFSMSGVNSVTPEFEPENRNSQDILLRNDGGRFTDVTDMWNIPKGVNSLGVTVGDFNNDSFQDLFVYRWGNINKRISDYMLLNDGNGQFQTVTMHGANDVGGPGNGDMGQAFDFDLDGDVDLLNGSEGGQWYLYANEQANAQSTNNNYALVEVGYSPISNIDAISAQVTIKTTNGQYTKRVGSAGAIFSQSLLNIVHFGLGDADNIETIVIKWRNGETVEFTDKSVNSLFSSNKLDPSNIQIVANDNKIRIGSTLQLKTNITPDNANNDVTWSSSDDTIVSVDQKGLAKGMNNNISKAGQSATVTVSSNTNNISASTELTLVDWFPNPIKSVSLQTPSSTLITGQKLQLNNTVLPEDADDQTLVWSSSNKQVATVNKIGVVTAISSGETTIVVTSAKDTSIKDQLTISVQPYIAPYIKIKNANEFTNKNIPVGSDITLNVEYHAGTGNQVISSDEGGIRFWLRHFKSKWIPVKDITLIDPSVLKTESGSSTMTISLADLMPTNELPQGQFYQLRASFVSSNGSMYDATIYPLNLTKNNK
ncbi:VCBS repeat-containing protein [Psychrosphaera sp. F3M07]|uniref:FG-GAP-like repeat-containing protein n=1 Tax=Psychrosphaera sp. F3M07 TaxID=2841560 RepID=UPI001C0A272A|nr:FG-GAP-like repeat-containing protein [Psychrosphaera sp. F3M07]MBU2918840.1 VCBS repeat-containing protein [Psychrosphaera sp. F3M07]